MKYLIAYAWKKAGATAGKFGIDMTDDPIMWKQEMLAANPDVLILSTASTLTKEQSEKYEPLFRKLSKASLDVLADSFRNIIGRARRLK